MTAHSWTIPNPNSAVWSLDGTPFRVIAWQDRKTLSVTRENKLGNHVTVKSGFRSVARAKAFAEREAARLNPHASGA